MKNMPGSIFFTQLFASERKQIAMMAKVKLPTWISLRHFATSCSEMRINMYTIGQVSKMYNIPASTIRYYDNEGLFPHMERTSGIRKFGEKELEALKLIECLKKTGMEIKDIKQFMAWCAEGSSTYKLRHDFFIKQKEVVENEITKLQKVLDMVKFKCWYYEQAINDGNEEHLHEMIPDNLPADIKPIYDNSHN